MQYIRERLSLNLQSDQQTRSSNDFDNASANIPAPTDTSPKPPVRKTRDVSKPSDTLVISSSIPTISETISQQGSTQSPSRSTGTTGSNYGTPFQSPVVSEKWSPHGPHAEEYTTSPNNNHFRNHNQYVSYPSRYATPVMSGYVNHSFVDTSGSPVTNQNQHSHQAQ